MASSHTGGHLRVSFQEWIRLAVQEGPEDHDGGNRLSSEPPPSVFTERRLSPDTRFELKIGLQSRSQSVAIPNNFEIRGHRRARDAPDLLPQPFLPPCEKSLVVIAEQRHRTGSSWSSPAETVGRPTTLSPTPSNPSPTLIRFHGASITRAPAQRPTACHENQACEQIRGRQDRSHRRRSSSGRVTTPARIVSVARRMS